MKVLITGGAGFIGSSLALKLIERGHYVRVLDNLSLQIHGADPKKNSPLFQLIDGKVDFIEGTVTSISDWEKSIKGMDAIVHLAAETGTGQSMYEINRYIDVNISGTALLLDHLANNKNHEIKKIVIASSRAIYGEGKYYSKQYGYVYPDARNEQRMSSGLFEPTYKDDLDLTLCATDETSRIDPSSIYGITKQVQEQLVLTACKSIGINCCAFRYQNVYGPGQSLKNPYTGILSIFSNRILNGQSINIFEDGLESRDFVYIDDVVDATVAGLEYNEPLYESFNVGTGAPTTVIEVVKQLQQNYGKEVEIKISGNFRIGDIRHNYADISKLKDKLQITPKVSFEEGIKHFTKWVQTQPKEESTYEKSLQELKEKGLFK
ncbi:NAD-dependent epimerase/dehydratase family protein [Flavobacterium sp.]|uniref:NAD-dependent epimerase/dehydratase family protein n=1 Tax=Flavobacterium sp. TaxID=239 RepID=UPI00286D723F|nr:NAD-dependent epimerase/dehydratase family protein [Flavobacterium sp.]